MLIEKLHLPINVYQVAKKRGLISAGDLVVDASEMPSFTPHFEKKVQKILSAIVNATSSGEFNEAKYFSEMNISFSPTDGSELSIEEALLPVVEEMMGKRSKEILRYRFGLSNANEKTLDDLGQGYGVSRERIRQIEAEAISKLRQLLCDNFYTDKEKVHCHPGLTRAVTDVVSIINTVANKPISFQYLKDRVDPLISDAATLKLIVEVAGFQIVKPKYANLVVLPKSSRYVEKLADAIDSVIQIAKESSNPFSVVELLIDANKRKNKRGYFSIEIIDLALSFVEEIEGINGHYQCRTECLRKSMDIVFRFLKAEGPKHYAEIARYINSIRLNNGGVSERSLSNQMSGDDRFSPLGKSGQWALSELSPEIRTIKEVMLNFLNTSNNSATVEEIFEHVKSKRPVRKGSISIYLNDDNSFAQVSARKWGLAIWPEAKAYKQPKPKNKNRTASKSTTQIDKIRGILIEEATRLAPDHIKAREVVGKINQRLKLGYKNLAPLYTQISKTGAVEKILSPENELYYKVAIPQSSQWGPLIEQIPHEETTQNVLRALNYYNENEIDICFLLLSQEFEGVAMSLVHELLADGKIKSPPKNLAGCLQLLKNNSIISDESAVNILREQRNERHHGKAPSKSERQALFSSAPILVDIYINYIKFLSEQL